MPRLFLSNIKNLTTDVQKEEAYQSLLKNTALLNSPDGKKAASILEVALGKSRTFPEVPVP